MCDKRKKLPSAAYWYIYVKAKNAYVENSRYIKVQHHTLLCYLGEGAGYRRLCIKRVEVCD